jgi:hypothetical protein
LLFVVIGWREGKRRGKEDKGEGRRAKDREGEGRGGEE